MFDEQAPGFRSIFLMQQKRDGYVLKTEFDTQKRKITVLFLKSHEHPKRMMKIAFLLW